MYLIGVIPAELPTEDTGFNTDVMLFDEIERMREELRASGETTSDNFVCEVKKRSNNVWTKWISVGRAGNNDVVLRHSTVSKLHARIRTSIDGENVRFWMADAGSFAGTQINNVAIEVKKEHEIEDGDLITFGSVECYFVERPLSDNQPR